MTENGTLTKIQLIAAAEMVMMMMMVMSVMICVMVVVMMMVMIVIIAGGRVRRCPSRIIRVRLDGGTTRDRSIGTLGMSTGRSRRNAT